MSSRPVRYEAEPSLDIGTAGAVSLAGHACAALVVVALIQLARMGGGERRERDLPRDPPLVVLPSPNIDVQLPTISAESTLIEIEPRALEHPNAAYGGATIAHVDGARPGRSGDGLVREQALNLAEQDDHMSRDTSVMTSLRSAQLQRIEAGRARTSFEDERASREPMELTFVAMGERGVAEERRAEARVDPGRGLERALSRSELGADLGMMTEPGAGSTPAPGGGSRLGGPHLSPGLGFDLGRTNRPENAAVVPAHARPLVVRDDPSVAALTHGRPSDTMESEQAVSARLQSLMHASTFGGRAGVGIGGEVGGGAPGAGGSRGPGSTAAPLGVGGTGPGDLEKTMYLRGVQSKVHPLWANAFPKWAIAEGLGGTAIVTFVIESDGSVSSARVTRSSNVPEFDENVRRAVLRGAPFGPLPAALGPRFVWAMPFVAKNPAVRPRDPKSGPSDG